MTTLFVPEKAEKKLDLTVKIPVPAFVYWLCIWPLLIYRRIKYGYSFMRIPLTQGQYAIVDAKDYYKLARYKWCTNRNKGNYYAIRRIKLSGNGCRKQKNIRMHHEIITISGDKVIDHINHNGLDNRRANLRIATPAQNNWNRGKLKRKCSSQYKGSTWEKRACKWRASIHCNHKNISLGYFDDEKEAAKAYNAKAAELFGEFAALNRV